MSKWIPEEDKILIEFYETASKEKILSLLPGRTWRHCYRRSLILNLFHPKDDAWKKEEDDILIKFYPNTLQENLLPMLPGRTWKAITWKANALKLIRTKSIVQEETKKTNRINFGADYHTQTQKGLDNIKKSVQERYGKDNVFQVDKFKKQGEETNLEKYGVKNPQQCPGIQEQTRQTNQEKYGVDNPFQMVDRVQAGMLKNHGVTSPLKSPTIKAQQQATNMERYGFPVPAQNEEVRKKLSITLRTPEVKEKKYETYKKNGTFMKSIEEEDFYSYLKIVDPEAQHLVLHPEFKYVIDYYLPKFNLWAQYDSIYWHGKEQKKSCEQSLNIQEVMKRDALQNELISNLIRFWSDDAIKEIKNNTIISFIKDTIEDKLEDLKNNPPICYQYKKKVQYYNEDLKQLPFNPDNLKAIDFNLSTEPITDEITAFIERYEWLGTIGVPPKWCFTARFKNFLGGVVLINEPTAYSKLLGDETPKYEALIQRGASASWTPKNLGSRLIMMACKWMVNNTNKRLFVGYADINAKERGIIYRACNFDYLGNDFGASEMFKHPLINRTFTRQYLNRTSTFKTWCHDNKIIMEKFWFKENKFKNLETIPEEIKKAWYDWGQKIISESERIKLKKKMKYALILGKDKRETKFLRNFKSYDLKPYPDDEQNKSKEEQFKNYDSGKTRNRKNNSKDQFIKDNYGKMTYTEMAAILKESHRWVKRCLDRLTKEGKIIRINPNKPADTLLTENSWNPQIKNRAISLRIDYLKSTHEICDLLKEEFGFKIEVSTMAFWFKKFSTPYPTKEDWLKRFLPIESAKKLRNKKYRISDISLYLKDSHGVYISDDIIGKYLRSLDLV
jgi:transposase